MNKTFILYSIIIYLYCFIIWTSPNKIFLVHFHFKPTIALFTVAIKSASIIHPKISKLSSPLQSLVSFFITKTSLFIFFIIFLKYFNQLFIVQQPIQRNPFYFWIFSFNRIIVNYNNTIFNIQFSMIIYCVRNGN